jgi:hypothetical protein
MLEDKGATAGMAASKAFGHDKKWSTFKVFFVLLIVAVVVFIIEELFSFSGLALAGQVVGQILFVPISAWGSVIAAYIYITCGPSSTAVAVGTLAPGVMPSAYPQPSMQAGTPPPPPPRFCSACGSPLEPGARFCRYCGKAV